MALLRLQKPQITLSQSSVIFFFLLAGFIIFITLQGELSKYEVVLGLCTSGSTSLGGFPTSTVTTTPPILPGHGQTVNVPPNLSPVNPTIYPQFNPSPGS